jgi:hypothetical protein
MLSLMPNGSFSSVQLVWMMILAVVSPRSHPDVFLLGVQKSASTYLAKLMTRHPELCVGKAKEFHYFDRVIENPENKSILKRQYEKNFRICRKENLTFDATPMNWMLSDTIAACYSPSELSQKRFVVVLRHPVDREFSWYNHQVRSCIHGLKEIASKTNTSIGHGDPMTWQYSLAMSKKNCIKILVPDADFTILNSSISDSVHMQNIQSFAAYARDPSTLRGDGLYRQNMLRWTKYIKRNQILVFNFDYVSRNSSDAMRRIARFLNINANWTDPKKLPGVISSIVSGTKLDCATAFRLQNYFDVANGDLASFVNSDESAGERPKEEPIFLPLQPEYRCTKNKN